MSIISVSNDVKYDLAECLNIVEKIDADKLFDYQEIILNVLRLITNSQFQGDIYIYRSNSKVPKKWYSGKKYHADHLKYFWALISGSNIDETYFVHSDEFLDEKKDWLNKSPFPIDYDEYESKENRKVISKIAQKYHVHPQRYGYFLRDYIYFGTINPFFISDFSFIPKGEIKYRTRLVLTPSNPDSKQIVGYIQYFKDTSINQLTSFIEENREGIGILQKGLEEYPLKNKYLPETFKHHLIIFLLFLTGNPKNYTSKVISYLSKIYKETNLEDSNIRSCKDEFEARVLGSKDTYYTDGMF